ncbi:hypothetical protein EGW08_005123, partial [Elysia chlorotica]
MPVKLDVAVVSTFIPENPPPKIKQNLVARPHMQQEAGKLPSLDKPGVPDNEKESSDAKSEAGVRPVANKKKKWWSRTDGSPSHSSQPLSSRMSPLGSATTSSTWLTSLLSETDLKLRDIDEEMDSVLSQVCSRSHTDQVGWSSESLGFVGARSSSTTTGFTELRQELPQGSETSGSYYSKSSESERKMRPTKKRYEGPDSAQFGAAATSDSDIRPEDRTSTETSLSSKNKDRTSTEISLSSNKDRANTETSLSTTKDRTSAEISPRTSKNRTSTETSLSTTKDRTSIETSLSSDSVVRNESKTEKTESSVEYSSTLIMIDQGTQNDVRQHIYVEKSTGRSRKENKMDFFDLGTQTSKESKVDSSDLGSQTSRESKVNSSNLGTQTSKESKGTISDPVSQTSKEGTSGQHTSQQSGSLASEDSYLKSFDAVTSEISHEQSSFKQDSSDVSNLLSKESTDPTSSHVTSASSKSKTSKSSSEKHGRKHSSGTEPDTSSESVNALKCLPQSINHAAIRQVREKESQTQEDLKRKKRGAYPHRQGKHSTSSDSTSSRTVSALIEGLDTGVQTTPLHMSNKSTACSLRGDEGGSSCGDKVSSKSNTSKPNGSTSSSSSKSKHQRTVKQENSNLDFSQKATEASNLLEDPMAEAPKPVSYDEKKNQVLKMFSIQCFRYAPFQPAPNSSSLLYSVPMIKPSPVAPQKQGISMSYELSTVDTHYDLSGHTLPPTATQSSEVIDSHTKADVDTQRTRNPIVGEAKPPPGDHRGMGRPLATWQFMTPGLGNNPRGCTYRSTSITGPAGSGDRSLPYKASDEQFKDPLVGSDSGARDRDKSLSLTQNTSMPDKISEGLQQAIPAVPMSNQFRDRHQIGPDRGKRFPGQAGLRNVGSEKSVSEQTGMSGVSGSAEPSILDQLWQSERSKELSKSRPVSSDKTGSSGELQSGKVNNALTAGFNGTGKSKKEISVLATKQNLTMKQSQSEKYDPSTSSSHASSTALQQSGVSFVGNQLKVKEKNSRPLTGPSTYPLMDNKADKSKDNTDKPKQPNTSSKQFLATFSKELDTFVDTAAWSSMKSPSQIRIDWDKCSDERRRRQQEKLKKVVISEHCPISHNIKHPVDAVNNVDDTDQGIELSLPKDPDGRNDVHSSQDSLPQLQILTSSQTDHGSQSLKNQQDRRLVTSESEKNLPPDRSQTQVHPSHRHNQVQNESNTGHRSAISQPGSVFRQKLGYISSTQKLKVGSRSASQASPHRLKAKKLPAAPSIDSSPDVSESVYSTGKEDIASLDSWVSTQTNKSQEHHESSCDTDITNYGRPPKLPPSVEVLSPAEVKLLTTAEGLRDVRSETAKDATRPSTSGQQTGMRTAVGLMPYKTSGKSFTNFPQAQQPYLAAGDAIMSASQLSKFRTGRRPSTQFQTPGVPQVPSKSHLSASETSCTSFTSSDFLSVTSVGELSPPHSWTSVKTVPGETPQSYTSCDREEEWDVRNSGSDEEDEKFPSNLDNSSFFGTDYRSEVGRESSPDIRGASPSRASTRFASDPETDGVSESRRENKPNRAVEVDSAPDSRLGQHADFSTDYGSDKGTNY